MRGVTVEAYAPQPARRARDIFQRIVEAEVVGPEPQPFADPRRVQLPAWIRRYGVCRDIASTSQAALTVSRRSSAVGAAL